MFHHLSILAIVACAVANGVYGNHLIGDHVCAKDEKYSVTFEKHFKKNVTRREYVWCMSVPPRCSKYITEEVDGIKVVEEERIRKIYTCCEGYTEDKTQTYCIPECKSCINGVCTAPASCSCLAGFTGTSCNQTCETGFWGQNCALQCVCSRGEPCRPETGYCICEPGTTGFKCEISSNCTNENCNETNKTIPETMKNKTKESDVIGGMNFTVLPTQETSTEASSTNSIRPETTTHPQVEMKEKNRTSDYNVSITTDPVEKSKKNFNSIGKTHQYSDKKSEQWQMDQITIENSDESSVKNTILVFIVSIGIGVAVILILVAIMSIMIARYKKQRDLAIKNVLNIKTTIDNNKNRLSSEPIIHRSVFHAPLPDPPVFQNPVFTLRETQNFNKVQYSNFSELCTPDNQSQYDFPPSSGSYRAASLPDPGLETTSEPVYDEIPASRRPRPVSAITNCRHSCCGNAQCQWNNT